MLVYLEKGRLAKRVSASIFELNWKKMLWKLSNSLK
jgi:hypothetical protein